MADILSVLSVKFRSARVPGSVAACLSARFRGFPSHWPTALLVSITILADERRHCESWGVVVAVQRRVSRFSSTSPARPPSVVTTLDGYPMARRGQAYRALYYATIYSFIGSVFGLAALALLAGPVSSLAIKFRPMDYFLLALFGLATVGSVTSKSYVKGLITAALGLIISMIGLDPLVGTPRLIFGVSQLRAGISTVPALVGLFGFAEVLSVIFDGHMSQTVERMNHERMSLRECCATEALAVYVPAGTLVGALPRAGGPWRRSSPTTRRSAW